MSAMNVNSNTFNLLKAGACEIAPLSVSWFNRIRTVLPGRPPRVGADRCARVMVPRSITFRRRFLPILLSAFVLCALPAVAQRETDTPKSLA